MGSGFEFERFLTLDDNRVFDNHGRGIAILNTMYPLRYMGVGNRVTVDIPLVNTTMYD